jgi:septal ring factor EnvC (AmiA/AmiB activator)
VSIFFTISNQSSKRLILGVLMLLHCSLSFTSIAAVSDKKTNEKLNEIQQAIAEKQATIDQGNKTRQQLMAQLKQDDLAIATSAKQIAQTTQQIKETNQKIQQLNTQQQQLEQAIAQQQTALAEQLRTAYSNGQHDYLKLLLNQQKPSDVQRALEYYRYLTQARLKAIDALEQNIAELTTVKTELVAKQQQLTQLKQQQTTQQQQLASQKSKREQTLKQLNKQLQSEQQQLAQLKAQEQNLVAALKALAAAAQADINLTGLKHLKRKLSWPVKGRIIKRFGTQKQGYLRWKGVLIAAPVGREVKAIHNGQVLFADWLNGYGLVTVIDHGDGYMSLYGHNQALLKNVGDRVETGEPIALVGQSGGQTTPGLYFEIRYKGKAMNPRFWCR